MTLSSKHHPPQADSWWASPAVGWSENSDATYKHYHRYTRSKNKLDAELALVALAFGYGSRSAYGKYRAWDDLVEQLAADWRMAGFDSENPWDTAEKAVKAGWAAAGASAEQPSPESTSLDEPHVEEPHAGALAEVPEHDVPGGRPDHPVV